MNLFPWILQGLQILLLLFSLYDKILMATQEWRETQRRVWFHTEKGKRNDDDGNKSVFGFSIVSENLQLVKYEASFFQKKSYKVEGLALQFSDIHERYTVNAA